MAVREVCKGRTEGILLFLIFGLSMYTTAMSVAFMMGFKSLIPVFQFFKEILVLSVLTLNILSLRYRPRFHLLDYAILSFLVYTFIYAILPIGDQGFVDRLLAFKSTSFYIVVYFAGRLSDPKSIFVNKYFNYIILLTIAAGAVLLVEVAMQQQLQLFTGYADYCYYFFNIEPSGVFGLSTTFDSDSGLRRFASFFNNPLEHAAATLLALSVIAALYTRDDNKFKPTSIGVLAIIASFLSIIFALSRAPLVAYFFIIYIYALVTKKKYITGTVHVGVGLVAVYLIYLFTQFENNNHNGLIAVLMNTVDFSDPSSVGHLVQWVEGIMSMIAHPLGLGLGTSGRVAGSLGENVGGENQFIIIGVQAGVIALLLYLAIYVMFIKTCLKWLPLLKGKERKICMAVFLIKVGFFIPMLTSEVESSSYLSYMNWFLSGILISMIMYPLRPQLQPANDH
ncbi:O-antigen ligase family protein [Mucilaginibacter corticis]|uniref:O-antigen ligase family protein n=1 Tax=Mucilaginibacter corticis TaxID=2597670 RepID=A0A556MK90_9SPHI|nr:O-antigen ligase family protein [Mucilaginibacter corticis]TSJ40317.1 O-antigen ligase family protein [Mucilaginibacter corticis]